MKTWHYLTIRLLLWAAAVTVAILPITMHDHVELDWSVLDVRNSINKAGVFRDLLYVITPVSLLSISTLLDHLCRKFWKMSGTSAFLSLLALIANVSTLCSGLLGFSRIAHNTVVSGGQLTSFSVLIALALIISLLTEIGVSFEHRR
jgi:hypothetical protein